MTNAIIYDIMIKVVVTTKIFYFLSGIQANVTKEKEFMKAKLSGIIAIVGAAVAVVYMGLLIKNLIPFIQMLDAMSYVKVAVGVVGAIVALAGGIQALKKGLTSVILRAVGAVLLIVFGVLVAFEIMNIIAIVVIAASIAVDYLVK